MAQRAGDAPVGVDVGQMAAEAEAEDFVNPADPDAFAGLLESNPDVDFIAEIPEDAARVVLQPDGSVVVGIDTSKVPADPASRTRRNGRRQRAEEARVQAESRAAFHALRAEQAVTYRRRVVQPRRYTYMALVGADMVFFLVSLLVQAFTSGLHMGRQWSSVGANGVSLYWWPTPKLLTLEEVAFSLVVDLVGVMAGFQEKPPVLGLFLLLDMITTILIGIHGISLFLLFRAVQLAACILYRNALVHVLGMSMTDEERLEFLSTELGIVTIFHTMAGFCGVLCGIEPQQARRASGDGHASPNPSPRQSSVAAAPEQLMATQMTASATTSTAGAPAGIGSTLDPGAAGSREEQRLSLSLTAFGQQAPRTGEAAAPQAIGHAGLQLTHARAPAGAGPLTTVAVFSFDASAQRSESAARLQDAHASQSSGAADWNTVQLPWSASHAAGAALNNAGAAATRAMHAAPAFSALLPAGAAPRALHAAAEAAAAVGGGEVSGSQVHTGAAMGPSGNSGASAAAAWTQPQPALFVQQSVHLRESPRRLLTLQQGLSIEPVGTPEGLVSNGLFGTAVPGRGVLPAATAVGAGAGARHGDASAGLGLSSIDSSSTPQWGPGLRLQALQLQLQLTQMSLRLQQQRLPSQDTPASAALIPSQSQQLQPSRGFWEATSAATIRSGGAAEADAAVVPSRLPATRTGAPSRRRAGVLGALLGTFTPSRAPIKPRRLQPAAQATTSTARSGPVEIASSAADPPMLVSAWPCSVASAALGAGGGMAAQLHGASARHEDSGDTQQLAAPDERQSQAQPRDPDAGMQQVQWQPQSHPCNGQNGLWGAEADPLLINGLGQQDTLSWRPNPQHPSWALQQQQSDKYLRAQPYPFPPTQQRQWAVRETAGCEASSSGAHTADAVQPAGCLHPVRILAAAPHLHSTSAISNGAGDSMGVRGLSLSAASLLAHTAAAAAVPVNSKPPGDAPVSEQSGTGGSPHALQQHEAATGRQEMLTAMQAAIAEAQRLRRAVEDRRRAADTAAAFTAAPLSQRCTQDEDEPLTGVAAAARAAAVPFSRSAKRREQNLADTSAGVDAAAGHTSSPATMSPSSGGAPAPSSEVAQSAVGVQSTEVNPTAAQDRAVWTQGHVTLGWSLAGGKAAGGPDVPAPPQVTMSGPRAQQHAVSRRPTKPTSSHTAGQRVPARPDEWAAGRGAAATHQDDEDQQRHAQQPPLKDVQHLRACIIGSRQRAADPGSPRHEQFGQLCDLSPQRR